MASRSDLGVPKEAAMRALREACRVSRTRWVSPTRWAVRSAAASVALAAGALWWWAVLRLAVRPDDAGVWEGTLAAGGWGLGLIPLHAVPKGGFAGIRPTRAWIPRRWAGRSGR